MLLYLNQVFLPALDHWKISCSFFLLSILLLAFLTFKLHHLKGLGVIDHRLERATLPSFLSEETNVLHFSLVVLFARRDANLDHLVARLLLHHTHAISVQL